MSSCPRLQALGYDVAEWVNTDYAVVALARPAGGPREFREKVSEAQTNKFAQLFESGKPVIITPYKPEFVLPPQSGRRGGRGGAGARIGRLGTEGPPSMRGPNLPPPGERGTNGPPPRGRGANGPPRGEFGPAFQAALQGRRGDTNLMQVAAPVRDTNDFVRGALALVIDPDKEFTKILSVARLGESGETYAFDQTGLLISRSRFEDQLKRMKLLDATNTTSALNLRLHEPGAAMLDGSLPLTHMVAEAVDGVDGVDVEPSPDYRGVETVGAWRWLPEEEIGVATQIDASEAYRPLRVLKLLFTMLCLLLLLCATGMFLFSYANVRSRRQLSEAELKLKQLGQYTLEEKIGEGGMGVVYRARHALMRRDTAVKLLLPDRADEASVRRFEREVVLTCQLTHPNTIQVYDYGHTPEGIFYYAMEYLRGLNLHELVARYGVVPEGRVVHILREICESLSEAHAMGLVHRDIKPGNIFLCERGGVPDCVKVLDFGLVREYAAGQRGQMHTASSELEGTPWFMPPESNQDSNHSDPRGDLYSVGALGYYLLTGQFVFEGGTVAEMVGKHLQEIPVPPGRRTTNPVSAEMDAIILKCLEKDPAARPQSAAELRDLLAASPRAADWTMAARAAWWAKYKIEAGPKPGDTDYPSPEPWICR